MKESQRAVWHLIKKIARYPLDVIAYALASLINMFSDLMNFEIKGAGKHLLSAIFAVFLRLAEVIVETSTKWKKDDDEAEEDEEDEEDQKIKWLGLEIANSRISQTVLFSGVNVFAWTALAAIIAFPLLGPVPLVAAAIAPTFSVAFSLWWAADRSNECNIAGLNLISVLRAEGVVFENLEPLEPKDSSGSSYVLEETYDGFESSDDYDDDVGSKLIRVARSTSRAVVYFVLGLVAMPFVGCMAVALLLEDILHALVSTAKIRNKKAGLTSAVSWINVLTNFVNRLLQVVTLPILFAIASYGCGEDVDLDQTDNVFALEHRGSESGNQKPKSSNLILAFKERHSVPLAVSFALLTGGVLGALVGTWVLDLLSLLPQLAMLSKEAKIIASVGLPLLVLAALMFSYWVGQGVKKYLANKFKFFDKAEANIDGLGIYRAAAAKPVPCNRKANFTSIREIFPPKAYQHPNLQSL